MSSIVFGGGLDVDTIVSQLIQAERAPARSIERARSVLAARESSLARYESSLRALSSAVEPLRSPAALSARTVTSSDDSAVGARAAAGTQLGALDITVNSLASTHSLASLGFAALDDVVPEGSFDITVGNEPAVTIDVGPGTTVEALRDQIAASGADVQAVVLFDGAEYRLSVTSGVSGAAGEVTVDNFTTTALDQALGFSQTSAASDAAFVVNGVSITRGSNHVTDVVEGLTLDLKRAGGAQATVNVAADPDAALDAVRGFVDSFNALGALTRSQLATGGRTAGPLNGISGVRRIQDQLAAVVSQSVAGLATDELNNLRLAGVELQNDGSAVLDEAALRTAIEGGGLEGLFGTTGRTTDSRVRFTGAATTSQAGTYAVEVTQAAERAAVTSGTAIPLAGLGQDETLTFQQGAVSVDVDLSQGQTIDSLVSTINAALTGSGIDAFAADDGSGQLQIASLGYGSAASVDVTSDIDAVDSTGVGTAGLADTGVDVAGTIDGVTAQGAGRSLLSTSGASEGVAVDVTADPSEVSPTGTSLGDVTVSLGVAESLGRFMTAELAANTGTFALERAGFDRSDELMRDRIEAIDRRLADREVFLTRQLTQADMALRRMDTLLASMQSQIG